MQVVLFTCPIAWGVCFNPSRSQASGVPFEASKCPVVLCIPQSQRRLLWSFSVPGCPQNPVKGICFHPHCLIVLWPWWRTGFSCPPDLDRQRSWWSAWGCPGSCHGAPLGTHWHLLPGPSCCVLSSWRRPTAPGSQRNSSCYMSWWICAGHFISGLFMITFPTAVEVSGAGPNRPPTNWSSAWQYSWFQMIGAQHFFLQSSNLMQWNEKLCKFAISCVQQNVLINEVTKQN